MAQLGWTDIRTRAQAFAREWAGEKRENAEAQTFWNEFFDVFGLRRRTVASFQEPVKTLKGTYGFIDLFWKGKLLAEHKTAGKPLDKAATQAFDYIQDLQREGRENEVPPHVIVSDYTRIVLHRLEPEEGEESIIEFELADFPKYVRHFAFITGQTTHRFKEEDPANLEAAQIMADLHDAIEASGYTGVPLERLLVRILFCLFANNTGIFHIGLFRTYIEETREDGRDLGPLLHKLFEVLDTPEDKRNKRLDEDLAAFPYVNGELYKERLPVPDFNRDMRNRLVAACNFNWERISPAIFGSLFQGIMDDKERRQIGAHYTSERDILKVIRPLFLDGLQAEFAQIEADRSGRRDRRLVEFQEKLKNLRLLDPACGCGNFLVISYRELRRLELQLLTLRYKTGLRTTEMDLGEVAKLSKVDVDQFYGIEIGEWAARIAETALWLTDHQMNQELSAAFKNPFQRIPLRAAPHIRCANSLRFDWNELLPAKECSYVLGNPPFVGAKFLTGDQKSDVERIAGNVKNHGVLDYVTMWYFCAAKYIAGTAIRCAFVSTNSISQGEQVGVLWSGLFRLGIRIQFAHRTFSWQSEARGKAHVHVVIIGFGLHDIPNKRIFEYTDINGEPTVVSATNINPYLVEGSNVIVLSRQSPICEVPEIGIGNKPIDGGNYLFTEDEKEIFLKTEPGAAKFFRPWIGSEEFINGFQRWCLWLGDASAEELRHLPECRRRIENVRELRKASKSLPTQKIADTPRRFHVENFPTGNFLVIPKVSSEKRPYIPIGYLYPPTFVSDLCFISSDATPYHFGVLTSVMHMAWVRQVCGRLESRYRYSANLVYNNFPWPVDATAAQKKKVEECAQAVLDARQPHLDRGATLADLYDPLTMPKDLLDAHHALDRAVDKCYRGEKFSSERERVEYLFRMYEQLTVPLAPVEPAKKGRRQRTKDGQ